MSDPGHSDPVLPTGRVALIALFITALITAQLTASKVLGISLPFSLPVTGSLLVLPGAAFAYALTFFATDCYGELYGRKPAQKLVNVGFVMNFVMLVLVWSTIEAPVAPQGSVDATKFATVLGASTNIVVGSLLAYIVSQNWDVVVFHKIKEFTDGDHLWARNIGSTVTSQAIDTAIFVGVAFFLAPTLLGTGTALPAAVLVQLALGQYVLKFLIALADTPFVYAVVGYLRTQGYGTATATVAD